MDNYYCHPDIFYFSRDIYSGHSPSPPGGGEQFLSKLKNREEFEGGLHEKRKKKEKK